VRCGGILDFLEHYNGLGYRNGAGRDTTPPSTSPYLWSMTDQYTRGKYVRDGVFDPEAVSQQVGAVPLLMLLIAGDHIDVAFTTRAAPEDVTWFRAHLLASKTGRGVEIGLVAMLRDSETPYAVARFSPEPSLQANFLNAFPNARNIEFSDGTHAWPGDHVTPPGADESGAIPPFSGERIFPRGADIQLSKNFHLSEYECRCGKCKNTVINGDHIQDVQALRDEIGKPVHINSGYRCPAHNLAVGGATNSQHLYGNASDITVKTMTVNELWPICDRRFANGGVGRYAGFVHVDSRSGRARWSG